MAYIHVRTDETLKKQVREILKKAGIDLSTAINMYLVSIKINKGIPFTISAKQAHNNREDDLLRSYPLPDESGIKKPTKKVPLGLARGEIDVDAFMEPLDPEVMNAFLNPKIDL